MYICINLQTELALTLVLVYLTHIYLVKCETPTQYYFCVCLLFHIITYKLESNPIHYGPPKVLSILLSRKTRQITPTKMGDSYKI